MSAPPTVSERTVQLTAGSATLDGTFCVPRGARGVVLFAHGSGSSRFSARNRYVAGVLQDGGLATLLIDLLTAPEEAEDEYTRRHRFDIALLAGRLTAAIEWLRAEAATRERPIGLFGASTGGGAALVAAAEKPEQVSAVVSRGGRPDLAGGDALSRVCAPTLLIVGGNDHIVVQLNQQALAQLRAPARLEIVPGASHLFEEPGALEHVARLARNWFDQMA